MADNVIEDGDEDERLEEAAESGASKALASALAIEQAKYDPDVARAAAEFLRVQTAETEEQYLLRMRVFEEQLRESKLRRFGLLFRNGTYVIFAAIAGLIALGLLLMLTDAITSQSVVVDAFKAPLTLANRGLTGDVVAENVLDALQKMQAGTRATDKGLESRGAWASDIKIDVPQTGVSIGDIDRLLHERFGHDLHIDGELIQTDTGGLALTVRGESVPAATFTGGSGDLGKLTVQAAEYIYGRSQPYRYAVYLENENRNDDAIAFLQAAFSRASNDQERASLANVWGNAYSTLFQLRSAAAKYRLAMSFATPRSEDWWKVRGNLVGALAGIDEETAWQESRALLAAAASAPKNEQPDLRLLSNAAPNMWDFPLALTSFQRDAELNGGAGASSSPDGPAIADLYGWMHDERQAARYIALSDPADPTTKAEILLLQGYAAIERGDANGADAPLDAFFRAWSADPNLQFTYNNAPCFTGLADGMAGHMQDAEAAFAAVFKHVGAQSLCAAFHGDVLVHAGDVAGAEKVWADGLKAGPDLPVVYLHRGLFEFDRNDLKAAEADLSMAVAKAPHWADTWKAWGDLLAHEGRWKAALAKYDEALKYAPAWAALHQARAAAARHAG